MRHRTSDTQRRGLAMMLVLLSVSMVTILAVAYLASRDNSIAIGRNIESAVAARWAALSALETGVAILETEVDWRAYDPQGILLSNYPLAGASISLIVADLATGEPPDAKTEHLLLHQVLKEVFRAADGVPKRLRALMGHTSVIPPVRGHLMAPPGDLLDQVRLVLSQPAQYEERPADAMIVHSVE